MFRRHPHREGIGGGYVEGMGIGSRSVKIYRVTASVKGWPFLLPSRKLRCSIQETFM